MESQLIYEIAQLLGHVSLTGNARQEIVLAALYHYKNSIIEKQEEVREAQKFREDLIKEHQEKI